MQALSDIKTVDFSFVRSRLLNRQEIALLDVREEDPHAQAHPLFAANFPLSRLEVDAYAKLPNRRVPVVTIDAGEGLAEIAARRLVGLGYRQVAVFSGGVAAWAAAGGELFRDVNVPSKSFGEFVEAHCHTPSLSAQEVKALLDRNEDVVVVDVRRFDEYQTMNIPSGISVPGAELVLRVPELAIRPNTRVIVNCAGRTRSIIGTQSLVNAGIPNPVSALRNGTIGWTLAGQVLETGASRRFSEPSPETLRIAQARSQAVADRAGVKRGSLADLVVWRADQQRTTYYFDPRTPEEYERGHLPGFRSAPGGQLVQETEMVAPVRGARIVLADIHGVRANMTASWLAQMAWEVVVIDGLTESDLSEQGPWQPPLPPMPAVTWITAQELWQQMKTSSDLVLIDFSTHAHYVRGHIPGAWYALRSQLAKAMEAIPVSSHLVLTASQEALACFAAEDVRAAARSARVSVLKGGNAAWQAAGLEIETGPTCLASPPIDRYRRPYEGTTVEPAAMQAYLDWEFGLVEQLSRDGTHHFRVI
ncbi:MAG: rhodanese-related sulfurtransferase [Burkholderiaceae bacterium]|nr:rhodanese-related sulfurtransferase [Burkholderiaceae bacterium]